VGSLPTQLSADLRDRLELRRAIETGTYYGHTAAVLARMFDEVVTVERSDQFYERASAVLWPLPNVEQVKGHSAQALTTIDARPGGTLYWLDAHSSGGETAGGDDPCPLLAELDAIGAGDPRDCLLIDDAREFAAPPDDRWPTLVQVLDELRRMRPEHHVTVVHDLIIAVPQAARDIVDAFGRAYVWTAWEAGEKARGVKVPGPLAQRLQPVLRRLFPLRRWAGRVAGRG